jgi:hypothetical protein
VWIKPWLLGWQGDSNISSTATVTIGDLTVPNQDVKKLAINTRRSGSPAIKWAAKITLKGPSFNGEADYGVDKIKVGFQQTAHIEYARTGNNTRALISSMEGKTYLDSSSDAAPWYDVTGNSIDPGFITPTTIECDDSPSFRPIYYYESPNYFANRNTNYLSFDLSVAAVTLDNANVSPYGPASSHLFREAYASWSVDGSGSIDAKNAGAINLPWNINVNAKWLANVGAGVVAPTGWDTTIAKPVDLLTAGPLGNNVVPTFTYVSLGYNGL